jgi:hypothetical protein
MARPTVLISHVSRESDTAVALENVLTEALLGGLDVFNTSNRTSLSVGDPWRDSDETPSELAEWISRARIRPAKYKNTTESGRFDVVHLEPTDCFHTGQLAGHGLRPGSSIRC